MAQSSRSYAGRWLEAVSKRQRSAQSSRPDAGRRLLSPKVPVFAQDGNQEGYGHSRKHNTNGKGREPQPIWCSGVSTQVSMQHEGGVEADHCQNRRHVCYENAAPPSLVPWLETAHNVFPL